MSLFIERLAIGFALLGSALIACTDMASADPSNSPLVLKAQGSFVVGGEIIQSDALTGNPGGGAISVGGNQGRIAANGMYTRFMVPMGKPKVPVVLIHGGNLSGSCYETTPDGRMGWDEYFVRKGHPVYVPDQVARARSGFDPTTVNKVKLGELPIGDIPNFDMFSQETLWELWRFGPTFETPYPDTRFPIQAVDQLQKTLVTSNGPIPTPNPTYADLAALADKLGGAVVLGHSQSACFPVQAALLNPEKVKGIIHIEGCTMSLTPAQIAILRKIPILGIYGDHVADADPIGVFSWQSFFAAAQNFTQTIKDAGGNATLVVLPNVGITGNSHMMMMDKNNLQVADVILNWIDENVKTSGNH
jgi:pimeloyl-ACP methyl ester carboxylesterase